MPVTKNHFWGSILTLLQGEAQLFENENYIGNSFFKLTSPKEKIEMFFGKDIRIRIKRELPEQQTDKKFIGDKKSIHYSYEIKVHLKRKKEFKKSSLAPKILLKSSCK